mmetsp:Transcript_26199/g.56827  ORF Transcript_26199/g.56827 Transcript_26199/m.56827 type:complete len:240 (+) Transcript_26199:2348-3067(+)
MITLLGVVALAMAGTPSGRAVMRTLHPACWDVSLIRAPPLPNTTPAILLATIKCKQTSSGEEGTQPKSPSLAPASASLPFALALAPGLTPPLPLLLLVALPPFMCPAPPPPAPPPPPPPAGPPPPPGAVPTLRTALPLLPGMGGVTTMGGMAWMVPGKGPSESPSSTAKAWGKRSGSPSRVSFRSSAPVVGFVNLSRSTWETTPKLRVFFRFSAPFPIARPAQSEGILSDTCIGSGSSG